MKYNCQIINETKAVVEIIPESDIEKSLFDKINEDNLIEYEFTLIHHYSNGLKIISSYAEFLLIDSFQKFPTKAVVSYSKAKGI